MRTSHPLARLKNEQNGNDQAYAGFLNSLPRQVGPRGVGIGAGVESGSFAAVGYRVEGIKDRIVGRR